MLTFNKLGNIGRLGNQMFEYAALKGIAKNRNFDWCIPWSFDINEYYDHQLTRHFVLDKNIKYDIVTENTIIDMRKDFAFNKKLYDNCPDNSDLYGYFQTEEYFVAIKDEIIKDFTFKKNFKLPAKEYEYNTINIRRGDYLPIQEFFPLCSPEYYLRGIEFLESDLPIAVVSDDIEWCKENIKADIYCDDSYGIHDLFILAHSKNNIIANSSFSWWGAWLNQNSEKKVVAPLNWFGTANTHLDTTNLIPSSWKRM
jgi:hypothetical protein